MQKSNKSFYKYVNIVAKVCRMRENYRFIISILSEIYAIQCQDIIKIVFKKVINRNRIISTSLLNKKIVINF